MATTGQQDLVQVQNPKTKRYVKIDRKHGKIVSHKQTFGSYKNVEVVGKVWQ